MANADELKRSIDRLNAELTRIESVPDPALMPVETVLFWERKFPNGLGHRSSHYSGPRYSLADGEPIAYKFIAIKVGPGIWYTTARDFDTHVADDDEMRDTLAGPNVSERHIVSEWLKLEDYEPTSPFDGPSE